MATWGYFGNQGQGCLLPSLFSTFETIPDMRFPATPHALAWSESKCGSQVEHKWENHKAKLEINTAWFLAGHEKMGCKIIKTLAKRSSCNLLSQVVRPSNTNGWSQPLGRASHVWCLHPDAFHWYHYAAIGPLANKTDQFFQSFE